MGKAYTKQKDKGRFRRRDPRGSPLTQKDNDQKKENENVHIVDSFKVMFPNVNTLTFIKPSGIKRQN